MERLINRDRASESKIRILRVGNLHQAPVINITKSTEKRMCSTEAAVVKPSCMMKKVTKALTFQAVTSVRTPTTKMELSISSQAISPRNKTLLELKRC